MSYHARGAGTAASSHNSMPASSWPSRYADPTHPSATASPGRFEDAVSENDQMVSNGGGLSSAWTGPSSSSSYGSAAPPRPPRQSRGPDPYSLQTSASTADFNGSYNNNTTTTNTTTTSYQDYGSYNIMYEPMPSSQSMTSLAAKRRVPVPAALDLGTLGTRVVERHKSMVPPPRAVVTNHDWDQAQVRHEQYSVPGAPDEEELAPPPEQQHTETTIPFPTYAESRMSTSPAMPLAVPLSAFGGSNPDDQRASLVDQRVSVASSSGVNGDRVSIDSYYLGAGGGVSPGDRYSTSVTPSTPDYFDPSNIDRRGLVGVGELATPRWGATESRHLRTPSMPNDFALNPPVPPPFDHTMLVGSAPSRPQGWGGPTKPEPPIGLGVGTVGVNVLDRVSEESPRRERVRHRSVSHESPQRPQPQHSTQQGLNALDSLLSLSSLGDFSFDSHLEPGQLAATLNMPEPQQITTSLARNLSNRASAPPAPKSYSAADYFYDDAAPPLPPKVDPDLSAGSITGGAAGAGAVATLPSPGSARERIYARRASRQQAQAAAAGIPVPQMVDLPPLPVANSTNHLSPPTSADSQTFAREARKTPPSGSKDREGSSSSKRRVPTSPSAPHHEILRHIAPKDFSHLPPSPSTASINQFLRGSSSGNNLSTVRTPPGSVSAHGLKGATIGRSESLRSRSRSQSMKAGEVAATAEALRKLDGLGGTPNKKSAPGSSSGGGPSSTPKQTRPTTPPDTVRRLTGKSSFSSVSRDKESPLNNWVEVSHGDVSGAVSSTRSRASRGASLHGSEVPPLTFEKAQESSPSLVGTPTSRDSHSHGTSATTPPSTTRDIRAEKAARRPSVQSDLSSVEGILDDTAEGYVPPVPPLPRGYQSMRQGLATMTNTGMPPQPMQYVPLALEDEQPQQQQQPHAPVPPPALAFPTPQKTSPEMSSSNSLAPAYPLPEATTSRTRSMSKKWSFSSALNLNKLHRPDKEPSISPTSNLSPPSVQQELYDSPASPQTSWSEMERVELASPRAPTLQQVPSRESTDMSMDTRSNHSVTPIAPATNLAPPAAQRTGSKRLTPSAIPFFRRASSSSVSLAHKLTSPPDAPTPRFSVQAAPTSSSSSYSANTFGAPPASTSQRTPSGTRKSMLGMHIPAMLRPSGSRRGISQQLSPNIVEKDFSARQAEPAAKLEALKPTKTGSIGRAGGRARGMTLSSGGDHGLVTPLSRKPSVDTRSSSRTAGGTPNGSLHSIKGTKLPVATGVHTLHNTSSAASLRKSDSRVPPSATPTKIPRMTSRPSVVTPNTHAAHAHMSMPPPTIPNSLATSRSANVLGSSGLAGLPSHASVQDVSMSEFGMGTAGTRQSYQTGSTSSAHRAHLLAPISARKHSVSGIPAPPSASVAFPVSKRDTAAAAAAASTSSGVPITPSRRTLPQLPSSATAMTISAQAKARPSVSRRGSATPNGEDAPAAPVTQIKSSKSFHTKVTSSTNSNSRLSLSSSGGAGTASGGAPGSRRTSLATGEVSSSRPESRNSPGDDEEALADAEMGAYVARRKARAASNAGRKDNLTDLVGFPEDCDPADAISQRQFITRHLGSLSDYERKEVLDFDFIYYMARNVSRPRQPDGKVYNHGYDDERGDYIVVEGDHLCYRYEVVGVLGKGSFGQVVHCRDHKNGTSVAVKIIRNKKRFHAQALVEVKILQQIVEWDPEDKHFMVKMTDHFYFRGHLCIVTELLSINLYELIKANQFCGFSTVLIRRFTTQMLQSLMLMRSHRIVHCDLKPENILLRHPAKSGIKVIDFGSSCHESEKVYTYIQSRFYRSPEVILGMNYAMAIDMWSLGCILAELYTGYPIFPGENEHEQLACIMEVLGVPDHYIVQKASRRKLFFDATGAPRPFVNAKGKRRRPSTKSLASVLKCNDELFVDFIAKCLTWDPDKRLKPQPAMRHPWILAGRRRQPPPPPEHQRDARDVRDGRSSFLGGSSSARRSIAAAAAAAHTSNGTDKKGGLIISPPTPLVARAAAHGQPATASRIGVSVSSARLHARNSTYVPNAQKVSMA